MLFDLDGTLVDLRAAYVRAHQLTALEVLGTELEHARILELVATGVPIPAHMAHLDDAAADQLVEVFVERFSTRWQSDGATRAPRDSAKRAPTLSVKRSTSFPSH